MAHGEAWEFFRLGKYLERACQTARVLDVKYHILLPTPQQVGTPVDQAHWVAILASCSGYEPYHKQRAAAAEPNACRWRISSFTTRCSPARRCTACARVPGWRPTHLHSGRATRSEYRRCKDLTDWLEGTKGVDGLMHEGAAESLTHVVGNIHGVGEAVDRTYFNVGPQTPPAPTAAGAAPREAEAPYQCAGRGLRFGRRFAHDVIMTSTSTRSVSAAGVYSVPDVGAVSR